ncbi:MAG: ComEC family competence protein [Alphaproteobacteria bacterium]|nr:ComEC family competence protein [Alphaproteobacteria bacterium]
MRDWIDNQWPNLFLYAPFLMAFGGALYFTLSHEPNLIAAPIITLALFVCIFIKRIPAILRGILLFLFGFYYAAAFTNFINTPLLKHNLHNLEVTAVVESIDYTDDKNKILLSVNAADIRAGDGVAQIRLSAKPEITLPNIGDTVKITGGIFKPSTAYAPETFDYARWAYFNRLTATGYIKSIDTLSAVQQGSINELRNSIHKNTNSFLSDTLILGYKNAVPKTEQDIWTATGIGHIWSISGFHMTLVGGWLFAIFYLLFRSIPYITKRIPAKIPAMGLAWIGLMFYLFLSGTDVATIRAFLMTTLVFTAFIFGRSAISMRNIALVFCFIFLLNPHYIMQAGFQLSFAAVFGLVWLYTDIKPVMPQNKFLKITYIAILTSVVATIFTAPFVAMHFGQIPVYGLIGNLILLPVFSFAIMPLILLGTLTSWLGWHTPINMAHSIYEHIFKVADWIAQLPYATLDTPHITNISATLFILAFIALILIKPIKLKVNYILFCVFISLGAINVYRTQKPVFFATYDHELVGFVNNENTLEFNKSRASNHYFAFDTWKDFIGQDINTPNKRRKHRKGLYIYETESFKLAYIQKFMPLMKNITDLCNDKTVDFIVSYFDIDAPNCNHKILRGGLIIYPDKTIKYLQTKRRWH